MGIKGQKAEAERPTVLQDDTFVTIRKTHNPKSSPELSRTSFLRLPLGNKPQTRNQALHCLQKALCRGNPRAGWPLGAEGPRGKGRHLKVGAAGSPAGSPRAPLAATAPRRGPSARGPPPAIFAPSLHLPPAARCPERCPHPAIAARGGRTHRTAPERQWSRCGQGPVSELLPACLPSCRPPLPGRPTNTFAAQPALLLFSPGPATRTRAAAPRRQWPRTAPSPPAPLRTPRPVAALPLRSPRFSPPRRSAVRTAGSWPVRWAAEARAVRGKAW